MSSMIGLNASMLTNLKISEDRLINSATSQMTARVFYKIKKKDALLASNASMLTPHSRDYIIHSNIKLTLVM